MGGAVKIFGCNLRDVRYTDIYFRGGVILHPCGGGGRENMSVGEYIMRYILVLSSGEAGVDGEGPISWSLIWLIIIGDGWAL